ncbi:MAG: hypothetical protein HDT30_14400 [Clostridiales bacterium]|nr:hypothetical protein [Clostridiales bacterium]
MKNHDDVIANVFCRRDKYKTTQKQKRKTLFKTLSLTACFCLLAFAGFRVMQNGFFQQTPAPIPENAVTPDALDVMNNKVSSLPSKGKPAKENVIHINQVSELDSITFTNGICIRNDDEVKLSKKQGLAYYGTNVYPKVPQDLTAKNGQDNFCIYKRNFGTGEVYFDGFSLEYSSNNCKRLIYVIGGKSSYTQSLITNSITNRQKNGEDFETSEINGEKVFIALNINTGEYSANFIYKDVCFLIYVKNLTEDEIISVISSLIK